MFQILLAAPSIIYAPIYIAKELCLSKWFAKTEICYPESEKLIDDLLRDGSKEPAILAVVDPMRILFSKKLQSNQTQAYEAPLVIGSLIKKKLVWGIRDFPNESLAKQPQTNYKIITYPEGMTAFTLVFNKIFENTYGTDTSKYGIDPSNLEDYNKRINEVLFHNIKPGEESKWVRTIQKQNRKAKISYVTMDPLEWFKSSDFKNNSHTRHFIRDEPQEIIFTGLVVGQESYQRYNGVIEDLLIGIRRGIKYIDENPWLAREVLMKYKDSKFNLSFMGWDDCNVYNFINALQTKGVYEKDLQIFDDKLQKSKEIWEFFFERRKSKLHNYEELLKKLKHEDFDSKYFLKTSPQPQQIKLDLNSYKNILAWEKNISESNQSVKHLVDKVEKVSFRLSVFTIFIWFCNYIYTIWFPPFFELPATPILGIATMIFLILTIVNIIVEEKSIRFLKVIFATAFFATANGFVIDYFTKIDYIDDKLEGDLIVGVAITVAVPAFIFLKNYEFEIPMLVDNLDLWWRRMKQKIYPK